MGSKSKIQIPLPKRPEPPKLDAIIEDIINAPDDDVIFKKIRASPVSANDSDNLRPDDDVQLSNSVEGVYNKVSLFCKLNALLQSAPDNLRTLQQKLDSQLLELHQYMDKVEEEMK